MRRPSLGASVTDRHADSATRTQPATSRMRGCGDVVILALVAARPDPDSTPASLSNGDLLGVLLTAEGLLFTALAVGVTLQTLGPGTYLPRFIKNGGLALCIALTITTVAVGAGATWWQLYAKGFPQHSFAGALAIAVAIAAQPILAFAIWRGMKGS